MKKVIIALALASLTLSSCQKNLKDLTVKEPQSVFKTDDPCPNGYVICYQGRRLGWQCVKEGECETDQKMSK